MSDIDESQTPTNEPVEQEAPVSEESQSFEDQLDLDENVEKSEEKPAEDEAKAEESKEEETKPAEEPKEDPEAPKPEEETPVEDEETERKRHNAEMAQRRIQEREKRQIEQTLSQAYQPQAADQLTQAFIEQGYNQFEAEMLARDERRSQQAQIQEARTQIAELNMQIETEAIQVMSDFPEFNPKSDTYDQDFATQASALYERTADVQTDPKTGVIVGSKITPYDFFKQLHDMRTSGMSRAQVQGQKAAEKQMAAVAPPTSAAPQTNVSKEEKEAKELNDAFDLV